MELGLRPKRDVRFNSMADPMKTCRPVLLQKQRFE